MVAISVPQKVWKTLSFPSTLYLCPILDTLLNYIPVEWQAELRLGLQEALVNAVKHGNDLDPNKTIIVKFSITEQECYWIICDQGTGFFSSCNYSDQNGEHLPPEESESGRGLCILYQIFDRVHWNQTGNELRLWKHIDKKQGKQPKIF